MGMMALHIISVWAFLFMEETNYFVIFPTELLEVLTPRQAILIGIITGMAKKQGYAYPSNQTLSNLLNVSIDCIKRDLAELEEKKHIYREIIRNDKQEVIQRRIYPTHLKRTEVVAEIPRGVGANLHGGSVQKSAIDNNNSYNNKLDKDNYITIAGRLYERDELFELCWKAYPRKEGKAAARKTWGKLKVEDIQLIQVHLPLFKKESSAKEKRYIPHFSTYLNQRRFEDEVEATNMGGILMDKINKLTNEIGHSLNNTLQITTNQ
jgi:hypothetical protein